MVARNPIEGGLPFKSLGEIERLPNEERWLVEGFLTRSGIAVLAATPKAGKTWVALGLAVGVASGSAALGRFRVADPGRVLLYPAEDDVRAIRERIEALCLGQGLAATELPIDVITADRLQLDDVEQRRQLEELVELRKPKLLVLDPLVRLHSGAESYVGHVSELFGYLRRLERRFGVAILVTHHVAKNRSGGTAQPGLAMRGSGDIHASYDHGGMLQRDHDGRIVLTLEHRSAESPEPVAFRLVSHEGGATTFEEVDLEDSEEGTPRRTRAGRRKVTPESRSSLTDRVLEVLRVADGAVSQVSIRSALRIRNQALTEALRELEANGQAEHLGRMQGWRVRLIDDDDRGCAMGE